MSEDCPCIPMPPHAYVPGQNTRHPEDWFDAIKASVHADLAPETLHQTEAFRAGLVYLEGGFYWESHEVLEAVWMQTLVGTPEREMVQALIQLANARLKVRMERPRAALRLCGMVEAHLNALPLEGMILGQQAAQVLARVTYLRTQVEGE